jgi:hypothetical protein
MFPPGVDDDEEEEAEELQVQVPVHPTTNPMTDYPRLFEGTDEARVTKWMLVWLPVRLLESS